MKQELIQIAFTFCMYLFGIVLLGTSLFPGLLFILFMISQFSATFLDLLIISLSIAAAYFIYGITLLFLCYLVRIVFCLKLQEGEYPLGSIGAIKWAVTNSLVLVVSKTFMDFMMLTPLSTLFFRMMGARVGHNVQINSKYCADLSLLSIGDGAVIGGHATVIGHSFERGKLILRKVTIGKQALIGLNSVVLPGCSIGDRAIVGAGAVLPKNTKISKGEIYSGVPAKKIKK